MDTDSEAEVDAVAEAVQHGDDGDFIAAGPILEIVMENFMCHANVKVELNPRVTFITGRNGSGKSAILTAICVTFGASAKNTQRASTAKDFIKNGAQYFKLVVVLMNEGEDAYQHELFGDRIIVERHVTASGSGTFKLKSAAGILVYTKRDELDKLVDHFNINVENPCTVLSQDKVKQFLHSGSPSDRFKYYFSATMLESVSEQLSTLTSMVNEAEEIVREREKALLPMKREWEQAEAVAQEAAQVADLERELAQLTANFAWSWVYQVDDKIHAAEETVDNVMNNKIPSLGVKIEEAKAAHEAALAALEEKKASCNTDTDEAETMREELRKVEVDLRATSQEQAIAQSEIRRKQHAVSNCQKRQATLERLVHQARQRMEQQTQAETSERDEEIAAKQAEIDAAKQELDSIEARETEATESGYSKRQAAQGFGPQRGDLEQRLNDANSYARQLSARRNNAVTAFGDKVPQLKAAIQRKHRSFSRPPIGPVGTELSLSDEKWRIPVEECAGKVFNSFIVHNFEDMRVLKQCAREVGANLNVIVYKFDHPPYAPQARELPDPQLLTMRQVLQATNPTVMNVLMDQCNIELVVLADSLEQARAVAFTRGNNVKEAYQADGTKSFLRGQSETTQTYNPNASRPPRLGVDVSEQLAQVQATARQVKEELDALYAQQRRLQAESDEADRVVAAIKREKAKVLQKVNGLERDKANIVRAAREAAEAASARPEDDMADLEEEIRTIDAEIAEAQQPIPDLERQVAEAAERESHLKASIETIKEKIMASADATDAATQEIFEAERRVKRAQKNVDHYQGLLPGLTEELTKAELTVEQERANREDIRAQTELVALEALVTERCSNPDKVKARMDKLEKKIRAQEARNGGTLEELQKRCKRAHKKYARAQKELLKVTEPLKKLTAGIKSRSRKLNKTAKVYRQEISWSFNRNLNKRGFTGKVDVDYKANKLNLEVTTADGSGQAVNDTRALSGGERSFSTVCFALALHELSESPFRAMDEFDVFMDNVNRRLSLETILEFAKKHKSQWMFITPQDISDVKPEANVKIFRMPDPRP